MFYSISAILSL